MRNKIKKAVSSLLALLMVFGMLTSLPATASAAEQNPVVHVSSAIGKAGDEVTLTVSFQNNPGLSGYGVTMAYDASKLTYISAEAGAVLPDNFIAVKRSVNEIYFNSYEESGAYVYGENLFTVTLQINGGAGPGALSSGDLRFLYRDHRIEGFEIDADGGDTIYPDIIQPTITVEPGTNPLPRVVVSGATGAAGDQVTLSVSLENNPGISGYGVTMQFDAAKLSYVSSAAGSVLPGNFTAVTRSGSEIYFNSYEPNGAYVSGSDLFTVTLRLGSGVDAGTLESGALKFLYKDLVTEGFEVPLNGGDVIYPSITQPVITVQPGSGGPLPRVTVSGATGQAGDEVTLTVSLSDNPGLSSYGITMLYDASKLAYISSAATVLPGNFRAVQRSGSEIYFNSYEPDGAYVGGSDLFTVTLRLGSGLADGVLDADAVRFMYKNPILEGFEVPWNGGDTIYPAITQPVITVGQGALPVPHIFVSDADGEAGENITLTVSLANNPGTSGYGITMQYDASKLTYISSAAGDVLPGNFRGNVRSGNEVYFNSFEPDGLYEDGETLFTVTMKINLGVPNGLLESDALKFLYKNLVIEGFEVPINGGDTIYPDITQPVIRVGPEPLAGALSIDLNPLTGMITANTSLVTGGTGAFIYQWSGTGVINSGASTLPLSQYSQGQPVTLTLTRADATGSLTANITIYRVWLTTVGATVADAASIAAPYGKAGDAVSIAYTLGGTGTQSNTLTYTGPATPPAAVTTPGTGTSSYTIAAGDADAISGVIMIMATFVHTNNPPLTGSVTLNIQASDGKLTALTGSLGGTGALTYVWSGNGVTNSGTDTLTADQYSLGQPVTVSVTRAGYDGNRTATMTVYEVKVTPVGASGADTVSIPNPYCAFGSVSISYRLVDSGTQSNTLTFSGVANPPTQVTVPGTGVTSYTFNAADAVNGVITITATFAHTNLPAILYGDVNGDGLVNLADQTLMNQYFGRGLAQGAIFIMENADVNGDSNVNLADQTRLNQYFARGVPLGPDTGNGMAGFTPAFGFLVPINQPEIKVSGAHGKPGDEITLTVAPANIQGIAGYGIMMDYDADKLTFLSAVAGDLLTNHFRTLTMPDGRISFHSFNFRGDYETGMALFTVTFRINKSAEGGILDNAVNFSYTDNLDGFSVRKSPDSMEPVVQYPNISQGEITVAALVSAKTTARDFISITETAKNSKVWIMSFTVTETWSNGETVVTEYAIRITSNNANMKGSYDLGAYTLIYDITGNGTNIKELRVVIN